MDFTDKIVLITGASRGVGRAAAIGFAERGARVAVHYNRNAEAANQTLNSLTGQGHFIVQADMQDAAAVKTMVDSAVAQSGGLDILVNNAGIYEEHPIATVDYDTWLDHWQRTIQTNLIGAANAAYCAARIMIERGGGRIVNVSSRGAFRGEPDAPAYGASKAGMNAMGQSLAKALAPYNVYVTTVAPGWIDTDMAAEHLEGETGASIRDQSPLRRVASPEEIAYTVMFLASEGAEYLTGAIIDQNGASYLRT